MASSTLTVDDEILAIADFMGISVEPVNRILSEFSTQACNYTEIAIQRTNLEMITGGNGECVRDHLLGIADRLHAPIAMMEAFERMAAAFPRCFFGIKAGVRSGRPSPSLYIRLLQPMNDVLDFLARIPAFEVGCGLPALKNKLARAKTMYGLAFFSHAGTLGVKTYTLAHVLEKPGNGLQGTALGFISHRMNQHGLHAATKYYLPDVNLRRVSFLDADWERLLGFLRSELGYQTAGHLAWSLTDGEPTDYKFYFERIGAIATDFSQR